LLDYVKKAQFNMGITSNWLAPDIFDDRSLQHFQTLKNLQDLAIAYLDFSMFPVGVAKYFAGDFSPTLRSLALMNPLGNRRQLLDFFRLFPRLDDIRICGYRDGGGTHETLDGKLEPIGGGLRGHLSLKNFFDEALLKDVIVAFGGMRFTSMRLEGVVGVPLILEACADTLETVYIYPGDRFHPGEMFRVPGENTPDS
jgi:hypothetical protein